MSKYKERIAQGLCGKCGNENPSEQSLCDDCRKKERLRGERRRIESKATGKCSSCGTRPRVKDRSRCSICLAGSTASTRRTARKRKREGLCQTCGKAPMDGKTICHDCSARATRICAANYHQRRAEGKCSYCNSDPEPGKTMCAYHLAQTCQQRDRLKREVMDAYGGCKCSHCPETDLRFLEIDHIDGGGRKHLREIETGGGHGFYGWLKRNNFPEGYRVLCRPCNNKAHVERCRESGKTLSES